MTWQLVGNIANNESDHERDISQLRTEVAALRMALSTKEQQPVDRDELMASIAQMVNTSVQAGMATVAAAIERPSDGRDGRDGKDADPVVIQSHVAAEVAKVGDEVRAAAAATIVAEVAKAIALIERPKDGRDGKDGRDVDVSAVELVVSAHVERAVAGIPRPKDGSSVTVDDLAPIVAAEVEKAVARIEPAKDGVGITAAFIDNDGRLIVTLSDGTMKDVGAVVRNPDPVELRRMLIEEVQKIPRPSDGIDGKDGLDGTLEGLEIVNVDERTWAFVRTLDSGQVGTIQLAYPLDRGVFRDGVPYATGDGVSFGGSFFIAQRAVTTERPEDGSGAWRLAVKRGRDGREGKAGPQGGPGPKGDRGEPGRNYT